MAKLKGPSLASIAQSIAAELSQPISLDEFTARVLERYPSQAKNVRKRVRDYLRRDGVYDGILLLDGKRILPASIALKGVRFRIPLDPGEIRQGVVIAEPAFTPFVKPSSQYGWMAVNAEFFDADDRPIPSQVIALPSTMPGIISKEPVTINHPAFELRDWFSQHRPQVGDCLLVTLLDLERGRFRLEFEPNAQRRQPEVDAQNRALADLVWSMLQDTLDEKLITSPAIRTAFARLPTARDYPGDHWLQVLNQDPRMRVTDWMIVTADHRFPFDLILDPNGEDAVAEQSFTPEEGARVYRFAAAANYDRRERIVEILGSDTLGDFDDVMRAAFRLDPSDHLSEFTRIMRRGKGKRPHRQAYGEINPFEGSAAMDVRLAGLGLAAGVELEYVYDFGDWLEHTLVLERIEDAKSGVKYPRIIRPEGNSNQKKNTHPRTPRG